MTIRVRSAPSAARRTSRPRRTVPARRPCTAATTLSQTAAGSRRSRSASHHALTAVTWNSSLTRQRCPSAVSSGVRPKRFSGTTTVRGAWAYRLAATRRTATPASGHVFQQRAPRPFQDVLAALSRPPGHDDRADPRAAGELVLDLRAEPVGLLVAQRGQDGEATAAGPEGRAAGARRGALQRPGRDLDDAIARLVALLGVDLRELLELQQHDRERPVRVRGGDRLQERALQRPLVAEHRQAVGGGPGERLERVAGADVGHDGQCLEDRVRELRPRRPAPRPDLLDEQRDD